MRKLTPWAMVVALGIASAPAWGADAVRGKALYQNTTTTGAPFACATGGCHGPDPTTNTNNIRNGANPTVILNAISTGKGGMGVFAPYIMATEAADIAAYIANPAAGTPSPAAALSSATLSFGNQVVGTTSATMSATLKNTGTANLVLSAVTLAGTNPGDFTRGGTCAAGFTVAPAATCSIDVTFKPTVLGARSATITVAHNASPSSSTLSVTGSGVSAPLPAAGLSATAVAFGNQTVGTTSAAKTVMVSNTGTATLTLGTITTTGTNPGDFAPSNCNGMSLNPGTSCTISVTFTPAALNARTATLSIPSNASGSPHGVALNGNGTSAPAPAVALNPTSLAFGNQTVGTTSAAKSFTLTNTGNAALSITSIAVSGTGFGMTHTCPASLTAGANCTVSVTFAPTSAAAFTGSVSIVSSAAGSPHSVAVSGSGTAPTVTAPAATLSPLVIDFGALPLNTTSAARTSTLTNTGNAPLTVTGWSLGGTNPGDFSQSSTCPAGTVIAAGASCTVTVRFTATATGTRLATVALASNAAGSPAIDLKGTGVVQAAAVATVGPTQVAFGTTRLGKTSDERTVRVRNTGTTPLVISSMAIAGVDFTQSNECRLTLAPGNTCEVKVRFKPTALGTRSGEFTVASNAAGSPHVVKLTGVAVAGRSHDDDECDDEEACSQSILPFSRKSR